MERPYQDAKRREVRPGDLFFASYGSPTRGPTEYPAGITPVHFGKKQMVSLSAPADSDHPQLFYTPEEFTDVVQRLNSSFTCPMALTADATDYLFQISNGHPAAVQALMRYIYSVRITLSMSFIWAHIF